jgi:hypothetical protein
MWALPECPTVIAVTMTIAGQCQGFHRAVAQCGDHIRQTLDRQSIRVSQMPETFCVHGDPPTSCLVST